MAKQIQHPLLAADIRAVLRASLERYGVAQYYRYRDAIELAREHLCAYPNHGLVYRPDPRYRIFHIRRRGLRARHQFVYSLEEDGTVILLRLLHDRMDVGRHVPEP
jgi:toxin ParE1/3/4